MRVSPSFDYTCHVCGTVTHVQNLTGYRDGKVVQGYDPAQCPACDAPLRFTRPVDLGGARELLLTLYGASFQKKQFGTVEAAVAHLVRTEHELDQVLALAGGLDFDQWKQQVHDVAGGKLDRHDREELAVIEKIRADDARSSKLRAASDPARQRLRAEHDQHMKIFQGRRP
jgi:hypothetical protein